MVSCPSALMICNTWTSYEQFIHGIQYEHDVISGQKYLPNIVSARVDCYEICNVDEIQTSTKMVIGGSRIMFFCFGKIKKKECKHGVTT